MTAIGSDLRLRDGRVVHLRAATPADEAEFVQTFERLSREARYMRFMRVVREPDLAQLRTVLASFPEAGIGLVATVPADDGIDIVGSADRGLRRRADRASSPSRSRRRSRRPASRPRDDRAHHEARRRGRTAMEGFVLTSNQPMLAPGEAPRLQHRRRAGRRLGSASAGWRWDRRRTARGARRLHRRLVGLRSGHRPSRPCQSLDHLVRRARAAHAAVRPYTPHHRAIDRPPTATPRPRKSDMNWKKIATWLLGAMRVPRRRPARCSAGVSQGAREDHHPVPAGGPTDAVGRLIAQKLQEIWGQPVLIDYKPGAGTAIGVDFVAKSAPDGYTFGMVNSSLAVNPYLRKTMPYQVKDLAHGHAARDPAAGHRRTADAPFNNLAELIAYAKKNPGKLSYGTPGGQHDAPGR
jgi:hypothetical protein